MTSSQWLEAMVAHTNDGMAIAEYCGARCPIVYVNATHELLSGLAAAEVLGKTFSELLGPDHPDSVAQLENALENQEECTLKLRNVNARHTIYWALIKIRYIRQDNVITHVLFIVKDVTHEEYLRTVLDKVNLLYREMSKRLEYSSETDPLTQLKNRNHLSTRGEFLLGAAKRQKMRLHALVIDIDNFRKLNLLGGSSFGDECLMNVAATIADHFCRTTDLAVRMCDDEFVIFCIEDEDSRVLERAEALRLRIHNKPIHDFKKRSHTVTVNIGIYSTIPQKNTTIESMIQAAGELIFQSKQGLPDQVVHQADFP